MWSFSAEWQVEPQNTESSLGQRIRHLYQQFRLAVRAGAMREHNGSSRRPLRHMKPAVNRGITLEIFKRNRHEA